MHVDPAMPRSVEEAIVLVALELAAVSDVNV